VIASFNLIFEKMKTGANRDFALIPSTVCLGDGELCVQSLASVIQITQPPPRSRSKPLSHCEFTPGSGYWGWLLER
jgi:hypothetical protein